jgi:hypothetical protein
VSAVPRLSIGLPVYNGERYLRETLDSVLSQDFGDFELIVSDNASSDATGEIAQAAARADRRVRYVRNPRNVGAAANFTAAFRHGSAELFKWACADDLLAAGFLGAAVRELDAHPGAVACYGQITLVDADGKELGRYEQGLDLRSPDVAERFHRARTRTGLLHVLQGVMRSEALRHTALYGSYPGSDEVLVAELALHGAIHEIAAPMLSRRLHAQAASAATSVEQQLAHLDPARRGTFAPHYWRHSTEHLRAALRAPLPAATRLALAAQVLRGMIRIRDHLGRELVAGARHLSSRRAGSRAADAADPRAPGGGAPR